MAFRLDFSSTDNLVRHNVCTANIRDGIRVSSNSRDNVLSGNRLFDNVEDDAFDVLRAHNLWIHTRCRTDFPAGTICP